MIADKSTTHPAYPNHESLYARTARGWRRFLPDVGVPRVGHPRTWVLDGWIVLNLGDFTPRGGQGVRPDLTSVMAPMRAAYGRTYGTGEGCWLPASEVPETTDSQPVASLPAQEATP